MADNFNKVMQSNATVSNLRSNPLVVMSVLGLLGGMAGMILAEIIQQPDGRGTFFSGNIYLSTGVWFALATLGIGAAMSISQGLLERNVEKSQLAALKTIPASFIGGIIAGAIAQKVYESLLGIEFNVIPRAIGWGVAGGLAGLAIGIGFGGLTRIRNGLLGGAIGGGAGGVAFNIVGSVVQSAVPSRFVGLAIIGLLIGTAIAVLDALSTTATLEAAGPEGQIIRYPLIGRVNVLGCANSVSVALTRDPQIREQHVRLESVGGSVNFACIGNAPPVMVNGQPTTNGRLNDGDVLTVGQTSLRLRTTRSLNPFSVGGSPVPAGGPMPANPVTTPQRSTVSMPANAVPQQPAQQSPAAPAARPVIQMQPKKDN